MFFRKATSGENCYITTTLPYVNAEPHIGTALELVHADIFARYEKLLGKEVFLNTGTDEHGQKIYDAAKRVGLEPQAYADEYARKFRDLKSVLGLSEDIHFIRTTDPSHIAAAQEFWRRCVKVGDIYKKKYKMKYCVGCELEKTDSELEGGRCPIHPNLEIETINEENYFFKFSKYEKFLLELYSKHPDFVLPDFRFNEIKAFVSRGLQDFSVSRLKSKMSWGVPVPDDSDHVMYVWFDALVSYISTLGWPSSAKAPKGTAHKEGDFEKWWPVIQFAGKDQIRMQAAMWQAMLASAGLPPSKQIVIHGFITSGGHKMSKSIGNVIDPIAVVREYGTDALRYYLARHVHPFEDSDFTMEKFTEVYNANLANGLGNLVSRVMKMATANGVTYSKIGKSYGKNMLLEKVREHVSHYEFNKALDVIFSAITALDEAIQKEQPFKTVKIDMEKGKAQIRSLLSGLAEIGGVLAPFLTDASVRILDCVLNKKMPEASLFPRKD